MRSGKHDREKKRIRNFGADIPPRVVLEQRGCYMEWEDEERNDLATGWLADCACVCVLHMHRPLDKR